MTHIYEVSSHFGYIYAELRSTTAMGTFPLNQRHDKKHNSSKDEQKKKPIRRQIISVICREMIIVNTDVMVINRCT